VNRRALGINNTGKLQALPLGKDGRVCEKVVRAGCCAGCQRISLRTSGWQLRHRTFLLHPQSKTTAFPKNLRHSFCSPFVPGHCTFGQCRSIHQYTISPGTIEPKFLDCKHQSCFLTKISCRHFLSFEYENPCIPSSIDPGQKPWLSARIRPKTMFSDTCNNSC
jgi:hypothetical protein